MLRWNKDTFMLKCLLPILCFAGLGVHSLAAADIKNYDVFLIPSTDLDKTIDDVSGKLKEFGIESLAAQGFKPHITLYLTEYPQSALDELKSAVEAIATGWQPFSVEITELSQTRDDWLMLTVAPDDELQKLSNDIVNTVSNFRNPTPALPSWVNSYPEKLATFEKYGSPNVFDNFTPHVTLLPKTDHAKLGLFMEKYGETISNKEIKALGIGIAEADSNGQTKNILATYHFGSQN